MTAHVARKGEPEEKHVSPPKGPTIMSNQAKHYMQQNKLNYGSSLPKVPTPQTPADAMEDSNFKLL